MNNTCISISHRNIVDRVRASVALESMMRPGTSAPPLLTGGELALNTAVGASVRSVSSMLGGTIVSLTQTETHSTLEVSCPGHILRSLIEQMAVADVLSQCYAGTELSNRYASVVQALCQQFAAFVVAPDGLRIRSWPV